MRTPGQSHVRGAHEILTTSDVVCLYDVFVRAVAIATVATSVETVEVVEKGSKAFNTLRAKIRKGNKQYHLWPKSKGTSTSN